MDTTSRFVHSATRPHHYLFAHRTLRTLFEERPELIMDILKRGQHQTFLEDLWFGAAELFGGAMFEDELRFDVYTRQRGAQDVAVVVMPNPRAVGEAYMLGLVVQPTMTPTGVLTWYYTLELGMGSDYRTPCTTLACWEGNTRRNHGVGPAAEPEAFLAEILKRTSC